MWLNDPIPKSPRNAEAAEAERYIASGSHPLYLEFFSAGSGAARLKLEYQGLGENGNGNGTKAVW